MVKVVEDVTTNDPSDEPAAASEEAEVSVAPAEPVTKEESSPKKVSPKKSTKKSKKSSPKKENLVEVSSDDGELVEETPVTEKPEVAPVEEAKETSPPSDNEESEDEEDEEFQRLTYDGVKYLRDEENTLYLDMEDDVEPVGTWDPVTSTPKFNAGVDIQALLAGE